MFKYRIKSVTTYEGGERTLHYPQYCQGTKFLGIFFRVVDWQSISGWDVDTGYAMFEWAKWDLEKFIEETEQRYKDSQQNSKKKDVVKYTQIKGGR